MKARKNSTAPSNWWKWKESETLTPSPAPTSSLVTSHRERKICILSLSLSLSHTHTNTHIMTKQSKAKQSKAKHRLFVYLQAHFSVHLDAHRQTDRHKYIHIIPPPHGSIQKIAILSGSHLSIHLAISTRIGSAFPPFPISRISSSRLGHWRRVVCLHIWGGELVSIRPFFKAR